MKKSVSRTLAMALAACMAAGTLAACGSRHFGRLWKQRFFRGRFQRS